MVNEANKDIDSTIIELAKQVPEASVNSSREIQKTIQLLIDAKNK